mgnify:FL=1
MNRVEQKGYVIRFIFLCTLAIGHIASVLSAAPGETDFPRLAFYERFVAIDNACGWPQLNVLPDGTLACLIWPHPVHGTTEGALECWISTDGGKFWKKVGVPVPNAPTTNRMVMAGGLAADGS